MPACFTSLQLTLGIVHGDLRLVCAAARPRKLIFHEFPDEQFLCDVASRGGLELVSECCSVVPVLSACVAYHFVAEPLLLQDASISQEQHLRLSRVAALAGQTFIGKVWHPMMAPH